MSATTYKVIGTILAVLGALAVVGSPYSGVDVDGNDVFDPAALVGGLIFLVLGVIIFKAGEDKK
jgi:hypothetical protein